MIALVCLSFLLLLTVAQPDADFGGGTSFTATPQSTISVVADPSSPHFPSDFIRKVQISHQNMYILGSNNIVQVYQKTFPNSQVQIFSEYSYANISLYTFVDMSVNQAETMMVLTSYSSGIIEHLLFSVGPLGVGALLNISGGASISTPERIFIEGTTVYAYIKGSGPNNDSFHLVDLSTNISQTVTLTTKGCSISVSPTSTMSITWDRNSKVYIYVTVGGVALDYIFTGNQVAPSYKTNTITFSGDGKLAIIQSDNMSPINVLNLTDYSVVSSFTTGGGQVDSVGFVDGDSRFIYIQKNNQNKVYDTVTNSLVDFNGASLGASFMMDPASSEVYSVGSSSVSIFGMQLMVDNVMVMSYLPPSEQQPFYQEIQYSQAENATVETISEGLEQVNTAIENTFSILFSTPLAIFFLSLFNYFTLASIYVLLDIPIPKVVFDYLEKIFKSCSSDLLTQLGFSYRMAPLAEERVNEARALHFEVTSDILPQHFNELVIYLCNILIFELLVIVAGRCQKLRKIHRPLVEQRGNIYLGLVVSSMIELLLPWKYSFFGSYRTLPSKITIGAQYILLYLLPFIGIATFLDQIQIARTKHKRYVLMAIINCWPIYEALVFPILVLLDSPYYFFSIIGVSLLFSFYSSFYVLEWKISAIFKVLYQIILHICFLVFLLATDKKTLGNTSILYLAVLLLGALHHFIESIVMIVRFIYRSVKKYCKGKLQVKPTNEAKEEEGAEQKVEEATTGEKKDPILRRNITEGDVKREKTNKKVQFTINKSQNEVAVAEVENHSESKDKQEVEKVEDRRRTKKAKGTRNNNHLKMVSHGKSLSDVV